MEFSEYLKQAGLTLTDFAGRLGVSKGRLSQITSKKTDWPADLALKAEAETGGELDAATLSSIIARARQAAA